MSAKRIAISAALTVAAALALLGAAVEAKQEPPKPPKPQLTVLTTSQKGALRSKSVKVMVEAKRGKTAHAEGRMLVDGYPEDYLFKLGPDRERLRGGAAKLRFGLSPRKREVLDFAIKTCRGTEVTVTATVAGRTRERSASLAIPDDC